MKPGLVQILRSRWFAACVHAGLWLLLCLALTNLGGKAPAFRERESFSTPPQSPAPVAEARLLILAGMSGPNRSPAPTPSILLSHVTSLPLPTPPPPPPTTRKIELTYLGFYQTGEGPKHAVVKLGDAFLVSPVGARVASNLFVAQATMQALTLTNRPHRPTSCP